MTYYYKNLEFDTFGLKFNPVTHLSGVQVRCVRFEPKRDKSGTFSDEPKCHEINQITNPILGQSVPLRAQI